MNTRALLFACSLLCTAPAAFAQSQSSTTVRDVRRDIAALSDPAQAIRDDAAARLRTAFRTQPALAGSATAWRARLAPFHRGARVRDFERRLHAQSEGAGSGGGGTTATYRLDDFWAVTVVSDDHGVIREVERPTESLRQVWVAPPAHFTGRWVTYFVNGAVSHDIDFQDGHYTRFRQFFDNGQLVYEQRYVNGEIDGDEVGFDREGHRRYEIHHAHGQNVGRWVHWFANGRVESEENYVAGQREGVSTQWREDGTRASVMHYRHGSETGQAAWDERGRLLYAHGSASSEAPGH